MSNLEIVKRAIRIPYLHHFDELYDILADDFIFRTPLRTIKGKQAFIDFEKERRFPIQGKTLFLFSNSEQTIFYHVNRTEFPSKDNLVWINQQQFWVTDGLITSIVINSEAIPQKILDQYYPELNQGLNDK